MRSLVIDVGTSGLRAAVVEADASVSNLHYEECAPHSPVGGLVEFDAVAMYMHAAAALDTNYTLSQRTT